MNKPVIVTEEAGREVAGDIPVRKDLRAEGWTLVGGRTPWEVAITLDDHLSAESAVDALRRLVNEHEQH